MHTADAVPTWSVISEHEEEHLVPFEESIAVGTVKEWNTISTARNVHPEFSMRSVSRSFYERRLAHSVYKSQHQSDHSMLIVHVLEWCIVILTRPNWPYSSVPTTFKSLSANRRSSICAVLAFFTELVG